MNTTDVVAVCATALTGGGIAFAGYAASQAVRDAIGRGYTVTFQFRVTPAEQPQPQPARSKYANDTHTRLGHDPVTGRFTSPDGEAA